MAHAIDMSNSRVNFALTGEPAWHKLGNYLAADASLEEWATQGGFNWEAIKAPVQFHDGKDFQTMPNRFVIHRSDTGAPLSVMSDNFRMTQPRQVIEFFRDIIEAGGAKMETAGMLAGGSKFWAMARFDDSFALPGDGEILPYLLLATSLDGSMSNTAMLTTVRVVCQNTLAMADRANSKSVVRIPHSTDFDVERVKRQLGLLEGGWQQFKQDATSMALRSVSRKDAVQFFLDVLYPGESDIDLTAHRPALAGLVDTWENGIGQMTQSAKGTVWGLINACTRYVDFGKNTTSVDTRLQQAWFGAGANLKARAYTEALKLVA